MLNRVFYFVVVNMRLGTCQSSSPVDVAVLISYTRNDVTERLTFAASEMWLAEAKAASRNFGSALHRRLRASVGVEVSSFDGTYSVSSTDRSDIQLFTEITATSGLISSHGRNRGRRVYCWIFSVWRQIAVTETKQLSSKTLTFCLLNSTAELSLCVLWGWWSVDESI